MATLKSLVQSLFKLSGSQAYPSSGSRQVDVSSKSFVATQDGYLILGATSSGQNAFVNAWGLMPMSCFGSTVCDARIAIPCAKGQSVQFDYGGTLDIAVFIPSKGSS